MSTKIINGDCLSVMPTLDACSVDAIVTDPPYGLSFMGKDWDHGIPGEHFWREALRVAKPGAHMVAFGGTRTHHRLMCAIEDAGWEIRDTLGWLYGSGFPKSHNGPWGGTALKPAWEPIILARKPVAGTVEANHKRFGTGALNIDACRVPMNGETVSAKQGGKAGGGFDIGSADGTRAQKFESHALGRWPANVLHDGSDEVVALFPQSDGQQGDVLGTEPSHTGESGIYGSFGRVGLRTGREGQDSGKARYTERGSTDFAALPGARRGDTGSAARFFYCAKADRNDRNAGCEQMPAKPLNWSSGEQSPGTFQSLNTDRSATNHHPTVKPTDLMRYLCRLITPADGLILDPFAGSGSTGKAALLEGFNFIGIELSEEYATIARARIYGAAPLFA